MLLARARYGAGYRAVAMDIRAYGRLSKPTQVEDDRIIKRISDCVGVVEALCEVLIGRDTRTHGRDAEIQLMRRVSDDEGRQSCVSMLAMRHRFPAARP